MQVGVGDAAWPVLGAIKWQRQYHAMLATPVGVRDIVVGNIGGITLRSLLSGAIFLVVAALLGAIPSWTGVFALVAVALVTVAYAAPMFALSANAETDTSFTLVFRLGVIPMFLFSGTFFPVEQLPGWLQPVAYVIPLFHGSSLARDATLGTMAWGPDLLHVGYLLLWVVVGRLAGDLLAAAPDGGVMGLRWQRRRRAQRRDLPTAVGRVPHRLPRAGVLPVLPRHRARRADRGRDAAERADGVVRAVRRAGDARHGGDERRRFDSTFNMFFKLKYAHTFDAMLATPVGPRDIALGEMLWSLMRGAVYVTASW